MVFTVPKGQETRATVPEVVLKLLAIIFVDETFSTFIPKALYGKK